ncbi:MAG: alpha/beta hydrolase [Flavobacteriaceae bacterium]|nr:alpha/beta hydrolase [Flavobacteriaceae bacterium]
MNHQYYKFSKFIIYTLIILFISSCTDEIDSPIDPIDIVLEEVQFLDVSYGIHLDQKYDIHLPEGRTDETTKVFVLIHGGSWVSGDKADMTFMVDLLKSRFPDYAIVNINYRLGSLGNSPFPMQIDDIEEIVSDLKSKSDTYQITDQYGFIGVSAGAHLSMLYSYKFDDTGDVSMVCSLVGPTNFTDDAYVNDPAYSSFPTNFQLITGINYTDNPEYYETISPYHVVTSSAAPTILFYGDEDPLIPTSQGVDMKAKLDMLGVTNEFTLYEGEGHGWTGANAIDTNLKLSDFITTHF